MTQLSAVELFRHAMAAARAGDKAKTRELLRQAVEIDPHSETTWQWLAGVMDDPLEATLAWEKVLALNPKNDKARTAIRPIRLQAGINAAKAKDIPTARRLLRMVVADEPKNEHGWLWLASVSESPREAKAHLERVLQINPNSKAAKKGIAYYEAKIAKLDAGLPTSGVVSQSEVARIGKPAPDTVKVVEPGAATRQIVTRPPRETPLRALVVDGSRTYRKLLGMTLALEDFELLEAEDADEAIDRIREEGVPDLILIDGKISGLDAFEFCKLLRQHPETEVVPVMLLNGPASSIDKFRSANAGINAILKKPIHPETLLDTARQVCSVS